MCVWLCVGSAAPPTLPPSTMKPHRQSPTGPSSSDKKQVFIRSFVFHPSLPIKIDYTTKWRFPTDTMVSVYMHIYCTYSRYTHTLSFCREHFLAFLSVSITLTTLNSPSSHSIARLGIYMYTILNVALVMVLYGATL